MVMMDGGEGDSGVCGDEGKGDGGTPPCSWYFTLTVYFLNVNLD